MSLSLLQQVRPSLDASMATFHLSPPKIARPSFHHYL